MTFPKTDAKSLLSSVFGFDAFRSGQSDIIDAVIKGQNTLAIMPTGGGKSLCYQLPALCLDGVTIVISPLIALMRDQVTALQAAGVAAGALTSNNSEEENEAVFTSLKEGTLKLLYMAPERLASHATAALLSRSNVSFIAVDEAHCVSQWGHDFRPDYMRIGALKRALNVPIAAFTATADDETREEIIRRLFDDSPPQTFLHGFDRPNIHFAFAVKDSPRKQILNFANARKGQCGIVYCATRSKTESLAQALREAGHNALAYHGGMEPETRRNVEKQFQQEDELIVTATIAFGMGIDKPDIRWVAHADLSKSVESYYQEIGRAGRDGSPAQTLTLFGPDDIRFRRTQIDESPAPADRKAADHMRLNALLGLAEAQQCRRQNLLGYFGESEITCGNCDLCDAPPELFDATTAVRKALSAVLRCDQSFGVTHLISVLLGQETDKVRQWNHDKLSVYSIGREYPKTQWNAIFRQIMGLDLIRPDPSKNGALYITEAAKPILRGEQTISLRKDTIKTAKKGPVVRALVSEEDAPLLSALKAKRRALSQEAQVPAYVVFPDRTLIEMAQKRPLSLDEMAQIAGVGIKKLERYGEDFLQVITGEKADPIHPARRKLAAKGQGNLYDDLFDLQIRLARGECGTLKPLTLSRTQLTRLVELKPKDIAGVSRILGDKYAERFGDAIIERLAYAP